MLDPPLGDLASDRLRSARLSPALAGALALLLTLGEALPMLDAPSGDLARDPLRSVRLRLILHGATATDMEDTVKAFN